VARIRAEAADQEDSRPELAYGGASLGRAEHPWSRTAPLASAGP